MRNILGVTVCASEIFLWIAGKLPFTNSKLKEYFKSLESKCNQCVQVLSREIWSFFKWNIPSRGHYNKSDMPVEVSINFCCCVFVKFVIWDLSMTCTFAIQSQISWQGCYQAGFHRHIYLRTHLFCMFY